MSKEELVRPPPGYWVVVRTPAMMVSGDKKVPCVEVKKYFPDGKWTTTFEVGDDEENEPKIDGATVGSAKIKK